MGSLTVDQVISGLRHYPGDMEITVVIDGIHHNIDHFERARDNENDEVIALTPEA